MTIWDAGDRPRFLTDEDFNLGIVANLRPAEHSPGIILPPKETQVEMAIQWILEIWEASRHAEWQDLPVRLPL